MNVATAFTGVKGVFVPIKDTIESFRQIIDGEADDIPEAAFFMVGSIKEAREKAKKAREEEKNKKLLEQMAILEQLKAAAAAQDAQNVKKEAPKAEPKKQETITPEGWGADLNFGDFGDFGSILNSKDFKFGE